MNGALPAAVCERLRSYVYAYVDPRNGEVFYVGEVFHTEAWHPAGTTPYRFRSAGAERTAYRLLTAQPWGADGMRNHNRHRKALQAAVKPLKPLIAGVVVALAAADIARRVFRHTQLFCPTREPERSWNPADYGVPPDRAEEVWFESNDGEMLYGWYCRAERPIASAVFCHGNTGNLTTVASIVPHLLDSGVNVLMFDYRGFGRSSGMPSFSGVVADGVCAARFHDTIRPQHLPSILFGYSLGGAIAAQVIRHHPFDGLILQSTFTTLPDITRATFPHLPLHWFAGNLFDTRGVLQRLKVPLMIIHGSSDEVVPAWMAHALYDACPSSKRIYMVDGALHKDCFVRDADRLIWAVSQFIAELPQQHQQTWSDAPKPSAVDEWIDAAFRYVRRHLRRHLTAPHVA